MSLIAHLPASKPALALWLAVWAGSAVLGLKLLWTWNSGDARLFLPGNTTSGHHQLELRCDACHLPDGGIDEQTCLNCHQAALDQGDSHPKKKFRDPRNAELLERVDAMQCITCHREHREETTLADGLTLPADFCFACHQSIADDRPSHKDVSFSTCGGAGCHNYHDNTALYEDFLKKHLDMPWILPPEERKQHAISPLPAKGEALAVSQADTPQAAAHAAQILAWSGHPHAGAGVNCSSCHGSAATWTDRPNHQTCSQCHEPAVESWLRGKHGLKLANGLEAMTPADARLPMHPEAANQRLSCSSCHDPHARDVPEKVQADTCLSCHADQHSLAWKESAHGLAWQRDGSGPSCARCHQAVVSLGSGSNTQQITNHDQCANLRPNEKMLRTVCLDCHGMAFALDALADRKLLEANFRGRPREHLATMEWVRARVAAHNTP